MDRMLLEVLSYKKRIWIVAFISGLLWHRHSLCV